MIRKAVTVAAILVAIGLVGLGIRHLWNNRDGGCACSDTRQLREAKVFVGESGTVYCQLGYEGIYSHSGNACTCWSHVSEAEYVRMLNAD